MATPRASVDAGLNGLRLRRQALPRCLLALALAVPGTAHPISLSQLLRLPLEQLLRLEISAPANAWSGRPGATLVLPMPAEVSAA